MGKATVELLGDGAALFQAARQGASEGTHFGLEGRWRGRRWYYYWVRFCLVARGFPC